MEEKPDWRSESYAKAFEAHDRADFAQEFLRRNPDYRAQYARAIDAAPIARKRLTGTTSASSSVPKMRATCRTCGHSPAS